MSDFIQKHCKPCSATTPPLEKGDVQRFLKEIHPDWKSIKDKKIFREFQFKNFTIALDFVNLIGKIAEEEGHHPDIFLSWGKVRVEIWTHKIEALSENDFILAAKIDKVDA